MKTRWLLGSATAVAGAITALLAACATDSEPEGAPTHGAPDGGDGAIGDAGTEAEADARPCPDCEYFPTACGPETLCATGPFGSGADRLDLRAQIASVQGRSSRDVWAVGALGAAAHFDGTTWTRSDVGGKETLRTIWVRGSSEVAFGTFESIYTRGITVQEGDAGAPSAGGWIARGSADVPNWQIYDASRIQMTAAWGMPDAQWLWCTTTTFYVSQQSGLWRMRVSPTGRPVLAVGIPKAVCRDFPCSQMTGVHGSSANQLWAVGYKGVALQIVDAEGDAPTIRLSNTQTYSALFGVWVSPQSEAWAVGANGTIRHHAGDSLLWDIVPDVPTTEDLRAISGTSRSDIWAVGDAGVVLHFDGTKWTRMKVAGLGSRRPELTAVWASEPGHVWIGGSGTILSLGGLP